MALDPVVDFGCAHPTAAQAEHLVHQAADKLAGGRLVAREHQLD